MAIVGETRQITKTLRASGVTLYYTDVSFITNNAKVIKQLARLQAVSEVTDGTGLFLTSTKHKCWLDIDQATAKAYLKDLDEQHTKQAGVIKQLEGRLANKSYVDNAPTAVVEQTKSQLAEAQVVLNNIAREQKRFSS